MDVGLLHLDRNAGQLDLHPLTGRDVAVDLHEPQQAAVKCPVGRPAALHLSMSWPSLRRWKELTLRRPNLATVASISASGAGNWVGDGVMGKAAQRPRPPVP